MLQTSMRPLPYYLNQVDYTTNATAWMIGGDQVACVQVRDNSCLGVADPLGCRIRVTRVHIRMIIYRTHGQMDRCAAPIHC